MEQDIVQKVKNNPTFVQLVKERSALAWKLSIAMLVVYYAFILTIAFSPATLGASLSGGITTVGIPVGIAIIIFAFILTGVYVKRANTEFDEMTQKIKDDIRGDA
jgi:uncharacterized membrane protein (DUF485 family)